MQAETNRAVALYRSLRLKEWDVELQERELARKINSFSPEEFKAYAAATGEIDLAMDRAQDEINHAEWAFSTARQHMHRAANSAGMDRAGV